eukprot:CAMPEP_0170845164 /NCGR_PEP_ID=MMETSP0734-20130129/7414_1 /TAXON_ID=186038 /ORGANISM="Fragilariopsis kerguelensis, Strain L26-C5" /LENGTH=118 /DNA_ID=CAMNT_0011213919 /DNA_START=130 /DNA_END=482 /DNA_ORIENTATION=+
MIAYHNLETDDALHLMLPELLNHSSVIECGGLDMSFQKQFRRAGKKVVGKRMNDEQKAGRRDNSRKFGKVVAHRKDLMNGTDHTKKIFLRIYLSLAILDACKLIGLSLKNLPELLGLT